MLAGCVTLMNPLTSRGLSLHVTTMRGVARSALSNGNFCNDGKVLYLHCPVWKPTVAMGVY